MKRALGLKPKGQNKGQWYLKNEYCLSNDEWSFELKNQVYVYIILIPLLI